MTAPRILFFSADGDDIAVWQALLREQRPEIVLDPFDAQTDPGFYDFALVYAPPPEMLRRMPQLRAIFSLFAGVEHLLEIMPLPDVPIVRMVSRDLAQGMAQYVTLHALKYHRQLDRWRAGQNRGEWLPPPPANAPGRRASILGAGQMGAAAATALMSLGFDVAAWSRSARPAVPYPVYNGREALIDLVRRTDILVIALPLTAETSGIVDAALLAELPAGAALINVARGAHVIDQDLIAALDSGRLAGATLDVFRQEPLPVGHPFWSHPGIEITPHVASVTYATADAARHVIDTIARLEAGKPLANTVDLTRGY